MRHEASPKCSPTMCATWSISQMLQSPKCSTYHVRGMKPSYATWLIRTWHEKKCVVKPPKTFRLPCVTWFSIASLLQNIVSFIGLFCKRDLQFDRSYWPKPPHMNSYGVALVSRIDQIAGLFCKRALWKRQYSAKETYNFIDPTDHSHPIRDMIHS